MSGDDEVGQHVIPTIVTGPKELKREIIYVLRNYGMGSDIKRIKGR